MREFNVFTLLASGGGLGLLLLCFLNWLLGGSGFLFFLITAVELEGAHFALLLGLIATLLLGFLFK